MTNIKQIADDNIKYEERFSLAVNRIRTIHTELWDQTITLSDKYLNSYFIKTSYFALQLSEIYNLSKSGILRTLTETELFHLNKCLYEDIEKGSYETSYTNPAYAVKRFGQETGVYLSALYAELRSNIPSAIEERLFNLTTIFELFIEIYNLFEEPDFKPEQIKSALYYYFFDYSDITIKAGLNDMLNPEMSFIKDIIMNENLEDLRYLYFFGEYVTENEINIAKYLNSLSQDKIDSIARTFTQGIIKGYKVYNMDMSCKKTVNIRYPLGFERIIKSAVSQFRDSGLEPVIYRASTAITARTSMYKVGFHGASANKQYEYDHRNDLAIIFDKGFADRQLSEYKLAYESMKDSAGEFAGPALIESFGEKPFTPVEKDCLPKYSDKHQKQLIAFRSEKGMLTNNYIPQDKISFTIIAFPVPDIGKNFEKIFEETVKVNTLDSDKYEKIQTKIISALDKGDYVTVTGRGNNHTDIKVNLVKKTDPEKQTVFENCLDDVNIPLGEVFTSPELKGTEGILHVTEVYLDNLKYKELELTFKDGCVTDYTCKNFDNEADNKKYIHENVLYRHDTLPIGEFAIGTNTTAYMMGLKYNISGLLPILIAEKTGPHFAVGDTCFSHEEELVTCNPDGRQMVAKENDFSKLRNSEPEKAYFNCHTDITIPYSELGDIIVHTCSGETIDIIKNGRFVLEGTEALNEVFDD
ncbi:MAG: aminopeptidase [Clostridium sp.]|uniref:aminopeptidase n=1 Tax=Butyribacter sp. TaxID=2822465 RepID=UPI002A9A6CFC|nr:aminopeptidase [Clostridium sp.]MDY5179939.1 aminopeptidase [Butyribacter sp.]